MRRSNLIASFFSSNRRYRIANHRNAIRPKRQRWNPYLEDAHYDITARIKITARRYGIMKCLIYAFEIIQPDETPAGDRISCLEPGIRF